MEEVTRPATFEYDPPTDTLFVHFVQPYAEQWIESVSDEVTVRLNPQTRAVETIEIGDYLARLQAGEAVEVPVAFGLVRSRSAA